MWIEIWTPKEGAKEAIESRPARALWIEIDNDMSENADNKVEAREGLVD